MAGSLSGHLIDQFHPSNPFSSSIVSHGPMSFNSNMHGTPYAQQSFSFFGSQQSSFANDSISEETARRIATLQVKLDQKLGPEYISQRPGPGGGPKLTYVEGWKIINLANEVFGFNGWSSSIVSLTTDFIDYNEETRRYNVGVTALMRVTLRDGVFHEDTGYGMLENSKSKGQALDKCKKEAVTDGLKRALRSFGNVMGNCLYDKSYTSEVIKVKFEPKKFNKDELHRRPEFEDVKPNISSTSMNTSTSSVNNAPPRIDPSNYTTSTPMRPPMQQNQTNQARPIVPLPPHMRPEVHNSGSVSTSHNTTNQQPYANGKGPAQSRLNAPITTPFQQHSSMGPPKPPQPQQQQQQQPNRDTASTENRPPSVAPKSSAAPPGPAKAEIDDDDSFGFNSDDDAFFAMADLGPAIGGGDSDMGRPIMDEDMGRPIDHEEGLLRRSDEEEATVPTNRRRESSTTLPTSLATASSSSSGAPRVRSRQELIAAALAESGEEAASGKSTNGMNQQNQLRAANSSTGGTALSSMRPSPVPQSRTTTLVQQNHQRYMSNRQIDDQNQAPVQLNNAQVPSNTNGASGQQLGNFNGTGKGGDAPKRPLPSIGGFNFPAGVTGENGRPSGIGIKRPAEAMNSSTAGSNFRGASPGMGLHHNPTRSIAAAGGRSILGALDITDGGDVKRRRS